MAGDRGADSDEGRTRRERTLDAVEHVVDRDEIRRLAEMVVWGECITFPNGVTIDKRPLTAPTPAWGYSYVGSAAKRVYGTLLSGGFLADPAAPVGP